MIKFDKKISLFQGFAILFPMFNCQTSEHPVSEYLEKLDKPVLVMQGAKDFQVKVDKDFHIYKKLLEGKTNASFKLYENLNHIFVPAIYEDISKAKKEYKIERHIGEEVIEDIAEWVQKN